MYGYTLNEVFEDVVKSGKPDFPFCLCWANHSWYKKTWDSSGNDKLLIEQTYPGESDYIDHFNAMLPAFKDDRYIKTDDGLLLFGLFSPQSFDDFIEFKKIWNKLAKDNGLNGFYFFGYTSFPDKRSNILNSGFDAVVEDYIFSGQKWNVGNQLLPRIRKYLFKIPKVSDYNSYMNAIKELYVPDKQRKLCVLPNYDHSPRSGLRQIIYPNTSPKLWGQLLSYLFEDLKYDDLLFIKSWNEWGEGNYMEPDLKYGRGFLEQLKNSISKDK